MLNDKDIAFYSAIAAVISALLTLYSLYQVHKQNKRNQKDTFRENYIKKLDDCYMSLSDYLTKYTTATMTNKRRMERENIVYLTESLREDLSSNQFINEDIEKFYGDISIMISDITYEHNIDKNIKDLKKITDNITSLKKKISTI